LFEEKLSAGPNERALALPDSIAPKGKVVVAGREAKALTAYLLSLDRTYPVAQGKPDTTTSR
ncbi:MAG: cytochrome-c oxidase, partial [Bacteroidota bacterium]